LAGGRGKLPLENGILIGEKTPPENIGQAWQSLHHVFVTLEA
jgi:hypothetical protein